MNFGKLADLYRTHAKNINTHKAAGDSTAKFRINNYMHAAEIINATYAEQTKVTKERVQSLPLTDYMKGRAEFFILNRAEILADRTDKVGDKGTDKVGDQVSSKILLNDLLGMQGIGISRAKQLIKNGLTSIAQLKMKRYYGELSQETRLFLKYPPVVRIPRAFIEKIDKALDKLRIKGNNIHDKYHMTIVGSYRRGKAFSSDIDVMVTTPVKNDRSIKNESIGILEKLSQILPSILKCKLHIYAMGNDKMSAIAVMDNYPECPIVKFDMFLVDEDRAAAMLLYSTGSKEFNIRMRSIAKKKGFLLNQNGIYSVQTKKRIDIKNERGFFDILGLEYTLPIDRI